jgi:hypothetical protein
MMANVMDRNVEKKNFNKVILAISKFYSRIVLKKLTNDSRSTFRKVEKSFKSNSKINADIQVYPFMFFPLNIRTRKHQTTKKVSFQREMNYGMNELIFLR